MVKDIKCTIKITEEARDYLHKKNKHEVSIEYPDYRTSCCCVFVQMPEIFAKGPKFAERYNKMTIDGIDVFMSKDIALPKDNDIVIDVETFLKIGRLIISGFSIND